MALTEYLKILPRDWTGSFNDSVWRGCAQIRQLFQPGQAKASSRTDFLDDAKSAEVYHHSHRFPCPLLFFTSHRFNAAEGRLGRADFETCRRLVAYFDAQEPKPAAQLVRRTIHNNLPFLKWAASSVLGIQVTPQDLAVVDVAQGAWNTAPGPWAAGVIYPTHAELVTGLSLPARNQTTYEEVIKAMTRIWNSRNQVVPKQTLRDEWGLRNTFAGT